MRDSARKGIAVGFFDGLHPGHQAILSRAESAITFANHPLSVLAPERAPKLLMRAERRLAAIGSALDGGKVTALCFTPELAARSAEDFAREYFIEPFPAGTVRVVCGSDWHFGCGGRGDVKLLKSLGIDVDEVPAAVCDGEKISSTRIRKALSAGDMNLARRLLGRPYVVEGCARPGKGVATKLGFPTVNLDVGDVPLRHGVYVVSVGGARAIANYGTAPTCCNMEWKEPVLEVHFIGSGGAPNGNSTAMSVDILRFVRDERKFGSLEELGRQIERDVKEVTA